MSQQTYLKVPFVWQEPKPLLEIPSRLEFKTAKMLGEQVLISTLVRVMESSIDKSDRKQVSEWGSRQAAEQFLAKSRDGFSYEDEWWKIGVNGDGEVVGFVLPVIYKGCAKEGLEEATLYYLGVLPQYRRQGFATDLLLKGTRILQDIGIWRVFCDTDANNIPMISTFKRVGYQQYSEPWLRPL